MKPRTKAEKEVDGLVPLLKPITEKDEEIGFKRLYPVGYTKRCSKTKCHCFECDTDYERTDVGKRDVCPNCGRRNIVVTKMPDVDYKYFAIMERVKQWQVVRYMFFVRSYGYGRSHHVCYGEMCQMWLHENGSEVARARNWSMWGAWHANPWSYGSDMSIKEKVRYSQGYVIDYDTYNFEAKVHVRSLIPILRKYGGYRVNAQGPLDTVRLLLKSSHHATLYQTKQLEVFGNCNWEKLNRPPREHPDMPTVWQMVKICTRHGYIIKDFTTWYDIMELYRGLGKDLHSPHYLCVPYEDIKKVHDRLVRKRMRREREARIEHMGDQLLKDKKLLKEAELNYKRLIGKLLLGVHIQVEDISIRPLQSVKEFYEEGQMMHHCVFTNHYYTRESCLILSARRKDKRLATIQLNTDNFRIIQCRGPHNSEPKMDREIREAITNNIMLFKNAKAKELKV